MTEANVLDKKAYGNVTWRQICYDLILALTKGFDSYTTPNGKIEKEVSFAKKRSKSHTLMPSHLGAVTQDEGFQLLPCEVKQPVLGYVEKASAIAKEVIKDAGDWKLLRTNSKIKLLNEVARKLSKEFKFPCCNLELFPDQHSGEIGNYGDNLIQIKSRLLDSKNETFAVFFHEFFHHIQKHLNAEMMEKLPKLSRKKSYSASDISQLCEAVPIRTPFDIVILALNNSLYNLVNDPTQGRSNEQWAVLSFEDSLTSDFDGTYDHRLEEIMDGVGLDSDLYQIQLAEVLAGAFGKLCAEKLTSQRQRHGREDR